jgi:pimeloyl-ACP methyl ester carboxylesterase
VPVVEIDRTPIFYESAGDGEPVVLVHGAWVDHTSWDAVIPRLAESFRVVAYDLRGHGQSHIDPPDAGSVHDDIDDLVALIDHLELGPVNIAGISSGACIALRLAIEHPALVRRVLPHEPPLAQLLLDDPENKPMLDQVGELLGATARMIEAGEERAAARLFFDNVVQLSWTEMTRHEQDLIASHAAAFGGQLRDPDAVALDATALAGLRIPVLLSQGETSPPFATLIVDELAALLPAATRVVVPGAGHVPQMTHPDAYVEIATTFLRHDVSGRW